MLNISGTAADRRSADGTGPSGLAGDRAFDNTESTQMGSAGGNNFGRAQQGDLAAIDALKSFTLQGWINPQQTPGGSARILSTSNAGFEFGVGGSSDKLRLSINSSLSSSGPLLDSSVNSNYGAVGQWTFFACTYDGTLTSNNVKFYVGTTSQGVSLVSTGTLNAGTTPDDSSGLAIGNFTSPAANQGRTYDGLIDNIRVFGSQTDNTGVLTLSELESVRVADVPEPSSVGLALMGLAGLLSRRRR
jgi:MYXO-CTERM domain-containing protein